MGLARSDFLAGLPSEGSSASISLNALAWGCCRDGGQSDFFLREHFPAETVGLQREQLMTTHRALFSGAWYHKHSDRSLLGSSSIVH